MTLRPRLRLIFLLLAVLTTALARPAAAWNDGGHMLTALIAWEQMNGESRAWAVATLERHPRFHEDFERAMPPGLSEADRARWIFARAATWPDVVRGFQGEDRERYHHSTWHYGLMALPLDAKEPATTRPTTRPADVHIVESIQLAMRQLRAGGDVPAGEKAISLCWLLHLIGDVHQPCHAGSLVTAGRFPLPEGDRGGNNVLVAGEGRRGNLHAVWDSALTDNRTLTVLTVHRDHMLADPALARLRPARAGGTHGARPVDRRERGVRPRRRVRRDGARRHPAPGDWPPGRVRAAGAIA